ncbi:hypothetical protein [Streptomyces sp. A012304]|uniref:hypothetical protein n=1 Tax=Streptomyces sp. A012304 TaxID=375446 RepID=UPI0028021582|nr:hypothetical protein ALMP_09890 [Streptomyces sp. A012304]
MWGPYLVERKDKVDQWGQRSLEIFRELAQDPATGGRLTSLGSRDLVPAPDLRPIRGQHVVVTNLG